MTLSADKAQRERGFGDWFQRQTFDGTTTIRQASQAAFEAGRRERDEQVSRLFTAVYRYAHDYMQDEAQDRECCISDDQHEAAKAVFEALKAEAGDKRGAGERKDGK